MPDPIPHQTLWRPAKILAATDLAADSERVLHYSSELARHFGAFLYLTHVIAPEQAAGSGRPMSMGERRAGAEGQMAEILQSPQMAGIRSEVLLEEGFFSRTIDALIRKQAIDLVIAGTHGHKEMKGEFSGSWAELIYRQAECPVIIVGPRVAPRPSPKDVFRNILFAGDFGRASNRAAPYACSLAREFGSSLTLLHVVAPATNDSSLGSEMLRETTRVRLLESLPVGMEQACSPQFAVKVGDPAGEILRFAKSRDADLIVMGAKSERLFSGHLPEPTTYSVAAAASCPVLTLRA